MATDKAKEIREEQQRLKTAYGMLYDECLEILFRYDPIGINFEDNTDEYSPEVGTILPRMKEAQSTHHLGRIIHEEFVRWFGPDIAGPESRYEEAAGDLWKAYQRFLSKEKG